MSFNAADFLAGLFDAPAVPSGESAPVPLAVDGVLAPGESAGNPVATDETKAGPESFADWVQLPDAFGRLGWEAPDLSEGERWWAQPGWDELPTFPNPCPVCGTFELWWDLLGGSHCQRCERSYFERSLRLAEKAAGIRARTQPAQKTLSQDFAPCVPAGLVDA